MMALPFFGVVAALLFGLARQTRVAMLLWAVSVLGTLALFRLHATSVLPLDF